MNLFAVINSSNRTEAEWRTIITETKFKTCKFKQTTAEVTEKHQLFMPIGSIELQKTEILAADSNHHF